VTTIVLSRRAAREGRPHIFSAGILMACGMMYLRLAALLALFNHGLFLALGLPFGVLAAVAGIASWLLFRIPDAKTGEVKREYQPQNPLEMRAALFFALLFLAMLIATRLAVVYLGKAGVYGLAAVMGVTDVDPFIMGMTQSAGSLTPVSVGAAAILVAAASNNLVKGIYAYTLCDRETGRQSILLLAGLAALGLTPLLWLSF
jgi:uncharacterized membrane protein (DUF4010 family)